MWKNRTGINKKSRWLHTGGFLLTQSQSIERTTTNEFNRIDDSRQIGGETMTIRTRRDDANYRSLNNKDWTDDKKQRVTLRSTPKLCHPFIKQGEFHYLFIREDIKAHLSYNRLDELWTCRFGWIEDNEEVEADFYPEIQTVQFQRDEPAVEMLEALIKIINDRWQNDGLDWIQI